MSSPIVPTHWYTADLHLGHENVIRLSRRPFRSVAHMDATLIETLWTHVGPDDVLSIVGNHDGAATHALPWTSISHLAEVADPTTDRPAVICHYPMMTWAEAQKGALHVFAHVHGNWRGARGAVNVGVDVWDYRPVTSGEITRRARTMKPHAHWGDVEREAEME